MAVARFKIIDAIYEPEGPGGYDYPVVEHIFRGETLEEALSYYDAHLTTDEFFRDCTETGTFRDEFSCPSQTWAEKLTLFGWKRM